jgi:hypothetical protein
MAYGTGGIVEYTDYNTIQQLVVNVLGQYSTGYGQSPQTITVNGGTGVVSYGTSNISTNRIRYSQWNALQADINALNYHLLGVAPSYNSSPLKTASATTIISNSDRAAYLAVAQALTNSSSSTIGGVVYPGCYALASAGQASLITLANSSKAPGWNGTATNTVNFNFASYQTAQYFFQAGAQLQFTASLTGGSSGVVNTKDYDWAQLLSGMGTIKFGLNSSTVTGSGSVASGIGFNQLTAGYQLIFIKTSGLYSGNQYLIYALLSGATVSFSIQFQDGSGQPNPPWGTDENVTGTITSTIQGYYATGSYVSVTPYVPSIVSSGP